MGLLAASSARIEGEAFLDGKDLIALSDEEMQPIRGQELAMIFQDPMTSLNPVYTIGWQLEEAVLLHRDVPRSQARQRATEMLTAVGIPNPADRLRSYPHEFSGGMRQRVMIAMALANSPKVLIADEPTTALDVTTQAQILNLIRKLKDDFGSAILFITHDLGVVAELCDDVLVMYGGRVAEQGPVDEIFRAPQHPYTWGLLRSMPARAHARDRLTPIPGTPPSLLRPPAGCRFNPRCPHVMEVCRRDPPPALRDAGQATRSHLSACHLDADVRAAEVAKLAQPAEASA
jgi:oligopeptide/dipeptide ABC transporter ATP-binding protein